MRRIVVLALLIVLSVGVFVSLYAGSLSQSLTGVNVETYSSSYPPNFIDHLPFVINETDIYYIVKDLTVNGDGITILANNTVLIGQGHTITGNGTGIGIDIRESAVTIINCNITNFTYGIDCENSPEGCMMNLIIRGNNIYGNGEGVRILGYIFFKRITIENNRIFNNSAFGLIMSFCVPGPNYIYNNFFNNSRNAYDDLEDYWSTSNQTGPNMVDGPFIGGNYWTNPTGNGYSDTCTDANNDGFGDTPYSIYGGGSSKDYLPLVDINPPKYSDLKTFSTPTSYTLNITWKDNVRLNKVILELDGANYTDVERLHEKLGFNEYYQVEHKADYSKSFQNLSVGTHYYRWYANDTRNYWNSTQLLSFNVTATPQINTVEISPTLEVKANITCEGISNITEIIDYTKLHFRIDNNLYAMNMNYNPQTSLYSTLTPVYTELANKTIQYYVEALDKNGNTITSNVYSYHVPEWVAADLNRDGTIDVFDIVIVAAYFGKP